MPEDFQIGCVIAHGLCVGCGACAYAAPSEIRMTWTPKKLYKPEATDRGKLASVSQLCPFSDAADSEDEIADRLWGEMPMLHDPAVGRYLEVSAGRVLNSDTILQSSSGGLTTFVLKRLMELGQVDGVIHVRSDAGDDADRPLMKYTVSHSVAELTAGTKSRYYPVELSHVLGQIRGDGKRYALVGVPCFIKAARLLAQADARLSEQIPLMIGLVCGHMKSGAFAQAMAWQMGVPPDQLDQFDFRVKAPDRTANAYSVLATPKPPGTKKSAVARDLIGADWGHVMFRPRACDFCDDIAAETADACFGDAWLPKYEKNWTGTNIHVVRHPLIAKILQDGADAGQIELFTSSVSEFVASQDANFRHRRQGLQVRLSDLQRQALPHPRKRSFANTKAAGYFRRRIYRLRVELGDRSHELFQDARRRNDFNVFRQGVETIVSKYVKAYANERRATPAAILAFALRRLGYSK